MKTSIYGILFCFDKLLGKHPSFKIPSKNYRDHLYILWIPDVYKSNSSGFQGVRENSSSFFSLFLSKGYDIIS